MPDQCRSVQISAGRSYILYWFNQAVRQTRDRVNGMPIYRWRQDDEDCQVLLWRRLGPAGPSQVIPTRWEQKCRVRIGAGGGSRRAGGQECRS